VRAATGELAWKVATGGEQRFTARGIHGIRPPSEMMPDPFDAFLSSPVVAGGRVYIGSWDRCLYALNADTGAVLWKFETGDDDGSQYGDRHARGAPSTQRTFHAALARSARTCASASSIASRKSWLREGDFKTIANSVRAWDSCTRLAR
jgi:glucose dehydrogenase